MYVLYYIIIIHLMTYNNLTPESTRWHFFQLLDCWTDHLIALPFMSRQGALFATYSALKRCAPAPVLEPVQSSSLAQRRGMKKLGSSSVTSEPKEKE